MTVLERAVTRAARPKLVRRRLRTVSWRRSGLTAGAFALSRLLVLAAAICGATLTRRQRSWPLFDPQHLSTAFGSVGNVLAAAVFRWDSVHYLEIARHGYGSKGQAAFFPLYPLLMRVVGWALDSDVVAGVAISLASFAIALALLRRLAALELGPRTASATILLLAFAPLSLFFSAVYTESLFLALSVGSLYAARRERIVLASALAALASVTRISGILLVVPIIVMSLKRGGRVDRRLAWLILTPAALGAFVLYLHSRGYGWLGPIQAQTSSTHAHSLSGPFVTVAYGFSDAFTGLRQIFSGVPPLSPSLGSPFSLGFQNLVLLGVLVVAVLALVACWRRLPTAYGAYATFALLLAIASPVQGEPLKSLDRYVLTIFPLWMAAAAWAAEHDATRALAAVGGALLAFYSFEFATWAFIA